MSSSMVKFDVNVSRVYLKINFKDSSVSVFTFQFVIVKLASIVSVKAFTEAF